MLYEVITNFPREPLTGDDRRLFDLVVRRFLGAFHPPAQWERVERISAVADEHFRTRARTLVVPGWRAVLPPSSEESAESARLPALVEGQDDVSVITSYSIHYTKLYEFPFFWKESLLICLLMF